MKFIFCLVLLTTNFIGFSQKNFNGIIKYKVTTVNNDGDSTTNILEVNFTDSIINLKFETGQYSNFIVNLKTAEHVSVERESNSMSSFINDEKDDAENFISDKKVYENDTLIKKNYKCTKATILYKRRYSENNVYSQINATYFLSPLVFNAKNSKISFEPFCRNGFDRIPLIIHEDITRTIGGNTVNKTKDYEAISIEQF